MSPDGDQGFEGNVKANVIYTLTDENSVKIEYEAESDKDTALNLTNHAYFNLENAEQGSDVRNHTLRLNADSIYRLMVKASQIHHLSMW